MSVIRMLQTWLRPLAIACLLLCGASSQTFAQTQASEASAGLTSGEEGWDQFTLFNFLFQQRGLRSLSSVNEFDRSPPQDTVVVLLGDIGATSGTVTANMREFIQAGGAALIATDQPTETYGISRFGGGRSQVRKEFAYRGFTDCPLIEVGDEAAWHPVFADVKQLVFNRPGFIDSFVFPFEKTSFLLKLPRLTVFSGRAYTNLPVVASGEDNGGRVLTVADHSLFINSMLPHADNGFFAINVVNWLSDSGRSNILFLVDGEVIVSNLSESLPPKLPDEIPPLDEIPDVPPDTLMGFGNAFLNEMQQQDVLNKIVANRPRNMLGYRYVRMLLLILCGMVLLFLLRRLLSKGPTVAVPPPRLRETVFELRHHGKVQAAVLRPTAEILSRETMRSIAGSTNPVDWDARKNDYHITGGFFFRRRIRKVLRELSDFANGTGPSVVNGRALRRLDGNINLVTALHSAGRLWRRQV